MPRDLRFGPLALREYDLLEPVTHVRARWGDAWSWAAFLLAQDCTWCCGPAMPVATLRYDYGVLRQLGTQAVATWLPNRAAFPAELPGQSLAGIYVRIRWRCERDLNALPDADVDQQFATRDWHGVAEIRHDQLLGVHTHAVRDEAGREVDQFAAAGSIVLTCYGLEHLLAREPIRQTFFDRGAGVTSNASQVAFNARGVPNCSVDDYDGAPVFYYDPADTAHCRAWSTRQIVKYLLRRLSPKDSLGVRKLIWRCPDADKLPDWDTPVVETEGQTVLGVIQRLVTRQRLYHYWVEVNEDGGTEYADLRIETLAPREIPLTAAPGAAIPAVTTTLNAIYDRDPATSASVRDAGVQRYDVVHVRGAPLLHVGTFSWADGTLVKGWTDDAEVDYEEGAMTQPAFAAAALDVKQRMNAAARSSPLVEDVYSRFVIDPDWAQLVHDGAGGPGSPLFAGDGGPTPVFWPEAIIEQDLPLYPEIDYSADRITTGRAAIDEASVDVRDLERRPVLVCLRRGVADPDGVQRWYRAEDLGKLAMLPGVNPEDADRITVGVTIPRDGHSVVLRVSGGAQHAIAAGLFAAQPHDAKHDEWDVATGCTVTLCLPSGERVEGRFPGNDPAGVDQVRRLLIDAGDQYQRVYVAGGTVVDVGRNGTLARSTGGWIERPTNVRAILTDLAAIAAAWYTAPHKVVSITTARLMSAELIQLGDMIVEVGDRAVPDNPHVMPVNAPVTQIRFVWPTVESADDRTGPQMEIETFAGELDPLAIGPARIQGNPFKPRRTIDL